MIASGLTATAEARGNTISLVCTSNTLMGVHITGENLLKYMEWSASYYNTTKEGDVTISFNLKYGEFAGQTSLINVCIFAY